MKTYNHALDYLALAGEKFSEGRPVAAAKCLARAVAQPDFPMAIAIIEANNQAAYEAAVTAAAKPATKKPVAAKSKVVSAEDAALESLVGDLDELDEEGDEDEAEEEAEEVEAEAEPEGEPEEVEDEAEEEEEGEESHVAALHAALASMTKPKKTAASAKRKPAAAARTK
jgi:hypothetical protein